MLGIVTDQIRAIQELATLLNKFDQTIMLLELLNVHCREKPGCFIGKGVIGTRLPEPYVLQFTNNIHDLQLFFSPNNSGYATHSEELLRNWEAGKYFGEDSFEAYYLGYPVCCVLNYLKFRGLEVFYLYHVLKRIIEDHDRTATLMFDLWLLDFLEIDYLPCTVGCHETHKIAQRFQKTRKVYSAFIPDSFMSKRKAFVKESLIAHFSSFQYSTFIPNFAHNVYPLLKSHDIINMFRLTPEFFQDIDELLKNPAAKKELIGKAMNYISGYNNL
jgi:hypothetical protein